MSPRCSLVLSCVLLAWVSTAAAPAWAADEELVDAAIGLFQEKDKDLRALGFEQVRGEAKGAANTAKFAAQLPKLSADAQAGLLSALADRGDAAALPAIVELAGKSPDEPVRVAAIKAVGKLGDGASLPLLVKAAESKSEVERAAAQDALVHLGGADTSALLAAEAAQGSPERRAFVIDVLATRRALDQVPELLPGAVDRDPAVRYATMAALAQFGKPEHLPVMLSGVLKATEGPERDAAEKAVVAVCGRIEQADQRAVPISAAMEKLSEEEQLSLYPLLGKVGGAALLTALEGDLQSTNAARRAAALEALCLWPDATVADELKALATDATHDADRDMTFRAFVRVGALRDKRPEKERFERLQQAMALAKTPEEQKTVLRACRQVYLVESLRFALPFLDQPDFQQLACETIVELAHHREVREPNKAEFDPALDRVRELSTDEVVKQRAQIYKAGQTWLRPQRPPQKFDAAAARVLQASAEEEAKEQAEEAARRDMVRGLSVAAGLLVLAAIVFVSLYKRTGS